VEREILMSPIKLEDIPKLDGRFYYIAAPYGDKSRDVVEARIQTYEMYDAMLVVLGHFTFSPLDKHHKLKYANIPGDYKYWEYYCKAMLKLSAGVVVLMLKGWDTSVGVQDEIKYATELGIPVYYVQ
jgi:hypothetical protein